jgi:hypothetical protein
MSGTPRFRGPHLLRASRVAVRTMLSFRKRSHRRTYWCVAAICLTWCFLLFNRFIPERKNATIELRDLQHLVSIASHATCSKCVFRVLELLDKFVGDLSLLITTDFDLLPDVSLPRNAQLFTLPFDCGLSFARNFITQQVKTPFVLFIDDDFTVDSKFCYGILNALHVMAFNKFDLVGGCVTGAGVCTGYQLRIESSELL